MVLRIAQTLDQEEIRARWAVVELVVAAFVAIQSQPGPVKGSKLEKLGYSNLTIWIVFDAVLALQWEPGLV